ncbi:MAG: YtxH domain-containing protein [Candidatus Riflemargulisbacteria bacterium]
MNNHSNKGLYFLIGALSGAVVALLLAPKSGKETREIIKKTIEDNKEVLERTKETAEDLIEKTKSQIEYMIENVS